LQSLCKGTERLRRRSEIFDLLPQRTQLPLILDATRLRINQRLSLLAGRSDDRLPGERASRTSFERNHMRTPDHMPRT